MKRFASDRVTGLMERMGLEGDVAIESRLVSKTIENAQSRVEGYNFDIRKRVVEYDDVINKQRETIYSERDKVLHNEDLGDAVLGFVTGELDLLAEQHLGPVMDDWDIEGLAHAVEHLGIVGEGIDADSLAELTNRDEIVDRLDGGRRGDPCRAPGALRRADLGHGRATGPAALHRPAVGGPPDRAGRLPARCRPARLRRHRPAGGVQARGVQALRRAAGVHPPPGRDDHLPGQRPGAAAGPATAATARNLPMPTPAADGDAPGGRRGTCQGEPSSPRPPRRPERPMAVRQCGSGPPTTRAITVDVRRPSEWRVTARTGPGARRGRTSRPTTRSRTTPRRPGLVARGRDAGAAVPVAAAAPIAAARRHPRPDHERSPPDDAPARRRGDRGQAGVGGRCRRPRCAPRPQRPLLLRLRPQVQEVPRQVATVAAVGGGRRSRHWDGGHICGCRGQGTGTGATSSSASPTLTRPALRRVERASTGSHGAAPGSGRSGRHSRAITAP